MRQTQSINFVSNIENAQITVEFFEGEILKHSNTNSIIHVLFSRKLIIVYNKLLMELFFF